MKIYSCVQIDMSTGKVVKEISHEYDGPVAECKGGDTEYEWSPEQRELFRAIQPLVGGLAGYGAQNMYAPSSGGVFTPGQPPPQWGQTPIQQGGQWISQGTPSGGYDRTGAPQTRPGRVWQPGPSAGAGGSGGFQLHGGGQFGGQFAPNLGAPSAPGLPSMQGVLSGVPMYDVPQQPTYDIPDVRSMMPGATWWGDLDPSIKAGIRAPYEDASQQLAEQLGAKGMTGSGASPYSGQAQAGLGQFWADAAPAMAQQGWGMVAPALGAGWGAELSRNQFGLQNQWAANLQRNQLGYEQGIQENLTDYQNQIKQLQSDYATSMQAWQMPYGMMGMTPQLLPTGILGSGSNAANAAGGAIAGGMGGRIVRRYVNARIYTTATTAEPDGTDGSTAYTESHYDGDRQ
jgi:hypothetical protein